MSAVDYPGLLAQLEQQDRALEQEREDLAVIMAAVRKRAGAVVPAGLALPPARGVKEKPPAGKGNGKPTGHSNLTDAQLTSMRRDWEAGMPVAQIAKRVKVSEPTVRTRAQQGGWKRPKTAPAAKAEPKGVKLSGSVRCTSCDVHTSFDPCEHCGHKLRGKGW